MPSSGDIWVTCQIIIMVGNEQVKELVKSAKIKIVDLSDADEEAKKWYRDMIEEDCNQQFANISKKTDKKL